MMDEKRTATMESIKKISSYADGYNLYSMDISYDYDLKHIIHDISDYRKIFPGQLTDTIITEAIWKEALNDTNPSIDFSHFGCTAFKMLENQIGSKIFRMGRNYDFKDNTSCMLVYCDPKSLDCESMPRFKSVGFAALNNINANKPEEDKEKQKACLAAPFICLDGINENGVSIAVLTLDTDPLYEKNPSKQTIATPLAIRLVLDYARSAAHAVELLRHYNMYAMSNRDYHFFITDNSHLAYIVEWDESEDRKRRTWAASPVVLTHGQSMPLQAATNFLICHIDQVEPYKTNNLWGHGKERYNTVMKIISDHNGNCSDAEAWKALIDTAQTAGSALTSNTQWSIVYNNTCLEADIALRRKYEKIWHYSLRSNRLTMKEQS